MDMINKGNSNLYKINSTEKDLNDLVHPLTVRNLIKRILDLLGDEKAEEIVFIDVNGKLSFTDYLLICQGRSQLHCKSIAQNIEYNLKKEGENSFGMEGEQEGNWALLDYGDVILHVFHPEIRKYYNLEGLYTKNHRIIDYSENTDSSK